MQQQILSFLFSNRTPLLTGFTCVLKFQGIEPTDKSSFPLLFIVSICQRFLILPPIPISSPLNLWADNTYIQTILNTDNTIISHTKELCHVLRKMSAMKCVVILTKSRIFSIIMITIISAISECPAPRCELGYLRCDSLHDCRRNDCYDCLAPHYLLNYKHTV